jgi:hypothetical protein
LVFRASAERSAGEGKLLGGKLLLGLTKHGTMLANLEPGRSTANLLGFLGRSCESTEGGVLVADNLRALSALDAGFEIMTTLLGLGIHPKDHPLAGRALSSVIV